MTTNEPRALTAALQAPAFVTRAGGLAMHVANRHVERWAPEDAGASRFRPLRNLGFVDRLVTPWIESAQRSASLRMFSQVMTSGVQERALTTSSASWLFPRPWYQDELDWMKAARSASAQGELEQPAPSMLTTRGTYVSQMPSALYEYVAPSLSVARPDAGTEVYSPLVPYAATQAAHVMSHAVAPLVMRAMSPGLRAVMTTMLDRASRTEVAPTRASLVAPELVTPPAPHLPADHDDIADSYAGQHAHVAELQRMARLAAERELAARIAEAAPAPARVEERIARPQGLHDRAREAAARDARMAVAPATAVEAPAPSVAAEIAAAVAALPPELSSMVAASIGQRPERAVQSIAELGNALRSVELMARNTGAIEATRGPRVVMPAGLGGLISTVEHSTEMREARLPELPVLRAAAPTSALGAAAAANPAALQHVAWSDRWLARFAGAQAKTLDLLAVTSSDSRMRLLADSAPPSVFIAPMFEDRSDRPSERGELGFELGFGRTRPQEPLPTLRNPQPAQPVLRIDDNAETPDDLLAAISFAATRSRTAAVGPAPAPAAPAFDPETLRARETLADLVAHAAPSGVGAGLSAQLASSPYAPALQHVVPLGTAPSFDVRALFGAGLSATYLAGLVSSTREAFDFAPTYVAAERAAAAQTDDEVESRSAMEQRPAAPFAQTLVGLLSLPLRSETSALADFGTSASYAAPGMIADRAHAWSVAQERSSSDLSLDFVPPELVLAARVYGLGPAEAAQAARLAVGGPGQLTAMAGAVDRTFVQAMAIEAERRAERAQVVTAYPAAEAAAAPSSVAFGVERRTPRGAFMWPAATTAAMGMTAMGSDGQSQMSVAALELLAAQAVAEVGTYAALSDGERAVIGETPSAGATPTSEQDALATASSMVPAARREKLESLYVAISHSPSTRAWSPAARAARALALAGRGDDAMSARDRAAVAWDVLPVVYGIGDTDDAPSTGEAAARAAQRREELRSFEPAFVESRPGLGGLSARAGEALGSYVSASAPSAPAASSSRSEAGAVLRAPTAAPELVETGRGAGRYGGGEVEIPAWFEQAARKMFAERSGVAGDISLAELTLVNVAPPTQIAASAREVSATPPVQATPAAAGKESQLDVETIANDVYRAVLVLMDTARARNGEPYL